MNRRGLLRCAGVILGSPLIASHGTARAASAPNAGPIHRVRAGEPGWPSAARWEALNRRIDGRLIRVESPLATCRDAPDGAACREVLRSLRNPITSASSRA